MHGRDAASGNSSILLGKQGIPSLLYKGMGSEGGNGLYHVPSPSLCPPLLPGMKLSLLLVALTACLGSVVQVQGAPASAQVSQIDTCRILLSTQQVFCKAFLNGKKPSTVTTTSTATTQLSTTSTVTPTITTTDVIAKCQHRVRNQYHHSKCYHHYHCSNNYKCFPNRD